MTHSESTLAASSARTLLSADEQRLVRTLHERVVALLEVCAGLESVQGEQLGERLVTLDELRLDPLGPVHVRCVALEALRERFDALRDGIPDGSAVVEARDALQALQATVAPSSQAAFELAESLERAAVGLARAHGEPGRAAQDAFDDLAARLRDGATPQSLTVLREAVHAALERLTAHTVAAALQALKGAPELEQDLAAMLQGRAFEPRASQGTVEPALVARTDVEARSNAPAFVAQAPADSAEPGAAPEAVEAGAREQVTAVTQGTEVAEVTAVPATESGAPAPADAETNPGRAPAQSLAQGIPSGEAATQASETPRPVAAGTRAWSLRDWLAEDAKHLSEDALAALFDPKLVERAREQGLTPADVRRTRSLLRTAARSAGQNAQRIDLAIALEALVVSEVPAALLPEPGALSGARKSGG